MGYDMEKAAERNAEFMKNPEEKGILVRCESFGIPDLPAVSPLESFDFPREIRKYCDQVILRHLRFAEAHAALDDDWLPALKPFLGIAEHSCFLGGTVSYGGNTSYHTPPLSDLSGWRSLRFDRNHPHYAMMLESRPEHIAIREMRKHIGWYLHGMRGSAKIRDEINRSQNPDEVFSILNDFFAETEKSATGDPL